MADSDCILKAFSLQRIKGENGVLTFDEFAARNSEFSDRQILDFLTFVEIDEG